MMKHRVQRTYARRPGRRAEAWLTWHHRILLNFEGQAEGLTTDALIAQLLDAVPA